MFVEKTISPNFPEKKILLFPAVNPSSHHKRKWTIKSAEGQE
jgi:hypothetical protein